MATRIETSHTPRPRRPAVPAHVLTAERDRALPIVQDGGLQSHTRTMGFSDE